MSGQYSFAADRYLLIGTITRAHGLNGELKIVAHSGQPENFKQYRRLALVAKDGRMTAPLKLDQVRIQGRQVIAKLATIDTKAEADLTVGMGVLLNRDDLPPPGENEFYLHSLVGLKVKQVDSSEVLGVVDSIFNNGAQEVLVVKSNAGEWYIPMIKEIVVRYDDQDIIIDPPPGLLAINED